MFTMENRIGSGHGCGARRIADSDGTLESCGLDGGVVRLCRTSGRSMAEQNARSVNRVAGISERCSSAEANELMGSGTLPVASTGGRRLPRGLCSKPGERDRLAELRQGSHRRDGCTWRFSITCRHWRIGRRPVMRLGSVIDLLTGDSRQSESGPQVARGILVSEGPVIGKVFDSW